MKLEEVDISRREGLLLNKEGHVLCPKCKKNIAWVAWGRVSTCNSCEKSNIVSVIDEPYGRKVH